MLKRIRCKTAMSGYGTEVYYKALRMLKVLASMIEGNSTSIVADIGTASFYGFKQQLLRNITISYYLNPL